MRKRTSQKRMRSFLRLRNPSDAHKPARSSIFIELYQASVELTPYKIQLQIDHGRKPNDYILATFELCE